MEHYNLEDQLQRKLKERSIAPSADAWERVAYNRQLTKKKNKKQPLWYWAAACLIIAFGIGLFAVLQNNAATTQQPIQVVVTTAQPVEPAIIAPAPAADTFVAPASVALTTQRVQHQKNTIQAPVSLPLDSVAVVNKATLLPQIELQKATEVAYALNRISQQNGQVTQNELDSLLLSAQKQIALERLKNTSEPASETALLKEAETEVDMSFREKALNIFKYKFKTIRIAIKD
ncbi:hypothetical protein [Flavobacterium subsaxonicum]|uniref:Uncharacterized protein n=1 Tax=Flavobacterium subsaxonicum WB 4.1-42 = DSM 21790 TaxID=1121898 RepID=A0A0A2MHV6_9FLAO|nr:hypothetical protein [Flavobacterium subsaxonicum]KGO92207.1 hypothetical protein Q766_13680 [Flavobacterium subsaxonicum WB 4.1-42 = DSM 21790]